MLRRLSSYCKEEQLQVNYKKTKVMIFGKRTKPKIWKLDNCKIEEVHRFKYLGIVVQSSCARTAHCQYAAEQAQRSANNILKFYRTKGKYFVPAALELYKAKTLSQLLYGSFSRTPTSSVMLLERVQSIFLRKIIQLPKCVSNARVRLETGMQRVEDKIYVSSILYWLKLTYDPKRLSALILRDNFQPIWLKTVKCKLSQLGFMEQQLAFIQQDQAKSIIKQRVKDISRQRDLAKTPEFLCPDRIRYTLVPAPYLSDLELITHRRAFAQARCSTLPTAVLEGRYQKKPLAQRLCPCASGWIESDEHVFLFCPIYDTIRRTFIQPILNTYPRSSTKEKIKVLLQDADKQTTLCTAKFCTAAMKLRTRYMDQKKYL
ncbi:uncharacterized protein LOC143843519 [Paroedura picta]|uniref:uncharacterized protein LOC143843519 n=1 Tax=Paroedura picta TaxID=143630 RepID=UPI004057116D